MCTELGAPPAGRGKTAPWSWLDSASTVHTHHKSLSLALSITSISLIPQHSRCTRTGVPETLLT